MNHNEDLIKLLRLVESKQNFSGEAVGQKPGDQVHGTDKAITKGTEHPFKGRLVGEETTLEDVLGKKYQDYKELQQKEKEQKQDEAANPAQQAAIAIAMKKDGKKPKSESVEEEKQRLDPKCWTGYRKAGTKMKGGVRVNNCVKVEDQGVAEAGPFSYGKAPRKGSVADLAAKKRKEQEKGKQPIEPKDQMIGTAKVTQGVAEGHADQQRKIFKKNGKPVGEVGIDRESSPGVGQWYMKCYLNGIDNAGYDSYQEAVAELKHCLKQGVAEDSLNEFAPGSGGDGRWYTDDEIADIIGEDWFEFDLSGEAANISQHGEHAKILLVQEAQSYFEDRGYHGVVVQDVRDDEDFLSWYISGNFTRLGEDVAEVKFRSVKEAIPLQTPVTGTTAQTKPPVKPGQPTAGSISPDEQVALDKINKNPVMKQQFDKLIGQTQPGSATTQMQLTPDQEMSLEKLKANAGLKNQYDRLLKQANPAIKS